MSQSPVRGGVLKIRVKRSLEQVQTGYHVSAFLVSALHLGMCQKVCLNATLQSC